jgi:beta-glucuronidase
MRRRASKGDENTIFSEAFQERYYAAQLAMLANSQSLRGLSPWVLKDFRTKLRTHPIYQRYWNRKGLFSETGQAKKAASLLAKAYAKNHPLR